MSGAPARQRAGRARRRRTVARATAGVGAAVVLLWGGWLALAASVDLPVAAAHPTPVEGEVDVAGVSHFHTVRSDGRKRLDAMLDAAAAAGARFAVVADHNVAPPPPAWHGDLLVVPAVELSTSRGHLLALGARESAPAALRRADPLGAAEAAGGVPVLAHPVNRRRPWEGDWSGAAAAEVVSGDSLFREARAHPFRDLLPAVLALPAVPDFAAMSLQRPHLAALERWTASLAAGEPVVGLCGTDAHGWAADEALFRSMKVHVRLPAPLPADPGPAAAAVVDAVAEGRVYCALDGLLDPSGFRLERWRDGARARLAYDAWPEAVRAEVELWRGDARVGEGAVAARAEAGPGLYHARVWLTVPWAAGTERRFLWILAGPLEVAPAAETPPAEPPGAPGP